MATTMTIKNAEDAYMHIAAANRGEVKVLTTRPNFFERQELIRAGSVIVFDANCISRWRDGLKWSSPRKVDGLVTYTQTDATDGPPLLKWVMSS